VPRSLSSRLVVFVVALVVVVVAAAGTATYIALHSFLGDRLNQQLRSTVSQDPRALIASSSPMPGQPYHGPQQIWLVLLDPNGTVYATPSVASGVPTLDLSSSQRSAIASDVSAIRGVTTASGEHLRVAARATIYEGAPVLEVAGLSTSEMDRTLHRLVLLEIAIGALAVAVALALTSWGVHLSLRPLNRVTRTAREVTAELSPDGAGLDRRVPQGDPETEVGQLADSFNSLMGTVETQFAARLENEQRMRQFLADASHELRTPLTSIRGYAELSRMRRSNGEPEQADTMERIESEGTRMSRLVDDLLLLARGDQGSPPQRELVDVSDLIEDAVQSARAMFPQRRIDVAAPPELQLVGDHDQLLRVLRNLITNAAVHTDPAGPIRVSAHAEGPEIVVRVVDSGPGLPPEQAQHVFERFWRADKARTRARGGSGLGLAIVAQIVGAHGGTVDFQSTVPGGSTVTLRLPAYGPDGPAEAFGPDGPGEAFGPGVQPQ
jgi:two-component system OmpR family sensor kinase